MKSMMIAFMAMFLVSANAFGAGSSSYKPSVDKEIKMYNEGVRLMLDKDFESAEKRFRKALSEKEDFAEAHNNLAYVLRKQGRQNYEEALKHYNRAIELNPGLPEPYMYRGVLYVQMNRADLAESDFKTLERMDSKLSQELRYVIDNKREKQPEQFFGVSEKM